MMPYSTRIEDLDRRITDSMREIDRLNSLLNEWTEVGNPIQFNPPNIVVDQSHFTYPPLETAEFHRITTQAISSGTWIGIKFDEIAWNTGIVSYTTGTTGRFTWPRGSDKRIFLIFGRVEWATTGGEHRSVRISDGSANTILSQLHGGALAQTFSWMYRVPVGSTEFTMQVYCSTASDLSYATFTMWEIGRE